MMITPRAHFETTKTLARCLERKHVYGWLVTKGYFPEPYVLPPCFVVTARRKFGRPYFPTGHFKPRVTEYLQVQFPKTDYTDRTFGIIDPEIHSDIAYTIARNWQTVLRVMFHPANKVCSYSFPIPLTSRKRGSIGSLRSGRMIYEFIEMAENDIAALSYRYKYLVKTDIKNFYPSVYTHSISWAIHGKTTIRKPHNRHNYGYFGNRLDKLFQNANDGCTNGLPIGPVVSDLAAEIVLSAVDRVLSESITDSVLVLRFKDDYRILSKTEQEGIYLVKVLQAALKGYRLELNDEKTECHRLPDGIFRRWVSEYHSANPNPKKFYQFKRFKETFLAVVAIDRNNPNCGVIDRFLYDIVTRKHRIRVDVDGKSLPKVLSLLLQLGTLRTKAFPKVLAIIEAILRSPFGAHHRRTIAEHLGDFLAQLTKKESENKYLISWIWYFLRANGLDRGITKKYAFSDPIVRATYTSRFTAFKSCPDFDIFRGVRAVATETSMLQHLDVFKPQ
jgi:hypothetical protein